MLVSRKKKGREHCPLQRGEDVPTGPPRKLRSFYYISPKKGQMGGVSGKARPWVLREVFLDRAGLRASGGGTLNSESFSMPGAGESPQCLAEAGENAAHEWCCGRDSRRRD